VSNRDLRPLNSFTIAAAVVDVKGNVKATQLLPAIKNLKPQQVNARRSDARHVIAPTIACVFREGMKSGPVTGRRRRSRRVIRPPLNCRRPWFTSTCSSCSKARSARAIVLEPWNRSERCLCNPWTLGT
jgi:hypothetical protein